MKNTCVNINLTDNETLDRLVSMVNQTNLVALDKTIFAVRRSSAGNFAAGAARCGNILERVIKAVTNIRKTI